MMSITNKKSFIHVLSDEFNNELKSHSAIAQATLPLPLVLHHDTKFPDIPYLTMQTTTVSYQNTEYNIHEVVQ